MSIEIAAILKPDVMPSITLNGDPDEEVSYGTKYAFVS